jgi:hypothetical protein
VTRAHAAALLALPLVAGCFLSSIDESRLDVDAGAGTDAAPPWIPCTDREPVPGTLCDDFDDPGEAIGDKWMPGVAIATLGGTVGVGTFARTAPTSFAADMPAVDGSSGDYAGAWLLHEPSPLPDGSSSLTLEVATAFEAPPFPAPGADQSTLVGVITFSFDPPCADSAKQRAVQIFLGGAGGDLRLDIKGFQEDCATGDDFSEIKLGRTLPGLCDAAGSAWCGLELRVAREPCAGGDEVGSATVRLDGDLLGCAPLAVDPFAYLSNMSLSVGMSSKGPVVAARILYDDVWFEAR